MQEVGRSGVKEMKLPAFGERVLVRCSGFQCLAVMDRRGVWKDVFRKTLGAACRPRKLRWGSVPVIRSAHTNHAWICAKSYMGILFPLTVKSCVKPKSLVNPGRDSPKAIS